MGYEWDLPSGNLLHNHGKIHHVYWEKSRTFDWAIFKFANCNSHYQRVWHSPPIMSFGSKEFWAGDCYTISIHVYMYIHIYIYIIYIYTYIYILLTYCQRGSFKPLDFHQPTNGNLGHLWSSFSSPGPKGDLVSNLRIDGDVMKWMVGDYSRNWNTSFSTSSVGLNVSVLSILSSILR